MENVKKTHMNELKNKCVMKELPFLEKIDCEAREEVLCYVGVVLAVGMINGLVVMKMFLC